MRNLSAKLKLTLLNSLLLTTMAVIVTILLFAFSDEIMETNSTKLLMEVVEENAGELEYDDRKLDLDDIDFFKNGVYTLLYSTEETLIYGDFPNSLDVPLTNKKIQEINIDGSLYYFYDILSKVEDHNEKMWVRGIISVDEASTANTILKIALFSLPLFIILGTVGCYLLVKLTFRPIDKIIKTAEDISCGEDLSLRINMDNSSEEILKLAKTFDNMLNRLESTFDAEKQFSQDVSHELRTPTAVILAQCEYALDSKANAEDKQEALEIVNKQALKMSKLISELLGFMRLERGIDKPSFADVNLSELVEVVCLEQGMVKTKNITIVQDIVPDIIIQANQTMIIRLVTNLLSNSFRYGKENGNVNVSLKESSKHIVLSIEDDGIGIEKEHLDRIFQRFYQINNFGDKGDSMGLGLSMAKQIAKTHGANILVTSEINVGSTFEIIFPKS